MAQLQSHMGIWGNIFAFPHILGSSSSYMTLQLLHSEFAYMYMRENFIFFFISAPPPTVEKYVNIASVECLHNSSQNPGQCLPRCHSGTLQSGTK
jgi:hypothetical protein